MEFKLVVLGIGRIIPIGFLNNSFQLLAHNTTWCGGMPRRYQIRFRDVIQEIKTMYDVRSKIHGENKLDYILYFRLLLFHN